MPSDKIWLQIAEAFRAMGDAVNWLNTILITEALTN